MDNIEKKFYKTFGIEPIEFDENYFIKSIEIDGKRYPKITNRILLELICIVTRYMNEIRQFDSVDEFKKATLEELIMLVEDDNFHEKCYEDVQSLFKGGE